MLLTVPLRTLGEGPFCSDSALASLPLACSKKMPYPPRIAHLPSPRGSQANPSRGPGFIYLFFSHPVTPFAAPHWIKPLKILPEPGTKVWARVEVVGLLNCGAWLGIKACVENPNSWSNFS